MLVRPVRFGPLILIVQHLVFELNTNFTRLPLEEPQNLLDRNKIALLFKHFYPWIPLQPQKVNNIKLNQLLLL